MNKYNIKVSLAPVQRKDGTYPVRIRVTWSAQRIDITLPESITPDWWDSSAQRPRPRYASSDGRITSASINASINRVVSDIDNRFARARVEGRVPSRNEIAEGLVCGKRKNASESDFRAVRLMRVYVAEMERTNGWQHNTSKHFVTISRHIEAYDSNVSVSDISDDWLSDFVAFLVSRGLQNSTITAMVSHTKWYLRWALRKGYTTDTSWQDFRVRLKQPDKPVVYLTIEELHIIMSHDYAADSLPHLNSVRDAFVLQCSTGLRYSDLASLTWSMITDDCIRFVTRKTSDPLVVELNNISRSVLAKYSELTNDGPDSHVMRVISNQKYNDYLKDVGRLAGIDSPISVTTMNGGRRTDRTYSKWELITSHVGRKTFVVSMLTAGVSPLTVMKWTGHKNYKTMEPYTDISDRQRRESVELFNRLAAKDDNDS